MATDRKGGGIWFPVRSKNSSPPCPLLTQSIKNEHRRAQLSFDYSTLWLQQNTSVRCFIVTFCFLIKGVFQRSDLIHRCKWEKHTARDRKLTPSSCVTSWAIHCFTNGTEDVVLLLQKTKQQYEEFKTVMWHSFIHCTTY